MVLRALARVGGVVALCAVLATGCEDDNLLSGPTPAGVTTGATVSVSTVAPPTGSRPTGSGSAGSGSAGSGSSGSGSAGSGSAGSGSAGSGSTTTLAVGAGAATVAAVELAVRGSAGGCWEVLAPDPPAGVTRQDLWFPPGASCGGSGWAIAVRVFGSPSALQATMQVATTAAATYRDGSVLVVVAPSAPPGVQTVVKSVPGLLVVPAEK